MDTITTDQLNTLSQQYLDMGNALLAFRENNTGISDQDNDTMEQLQNEILDKAGQLATLAAMQAGTEAASAVNRLIEVNGQITATLSHLADVQKVIDIAAAAINVVVAVISLKPGDIISATGGLFNTCGIVL